MKLSHLFNEAKDEVLNSFIPKTKLNPDIWENEKN